MSPVSMSGVRFGDIDVAHAAEVTERLRTLASQPSADGERVKRAVDDTRRWFPGAQAVLLPLPNSLGGEAVDAFNRDDVAALPPNDRGSVLTRLSRALGARVAAHTSSPRQVSIQFPSSAKQLKAGAGPTSTNYHVFNPFFEPMDRLPDADGIWQLIMRLSDRDAFKVKTNSQTGLVQTSDTDNADMLRQWFTDSAMAGWMQRERDPKGWQQSMYVNAAALNSPAALSDFANAIASPDWYRKGGVMQGVFHIYLPKSVQIDAAGDPVAKDIEYDKSWFNQKRLESQGLILMNLVDTMRAGMVPATQEPDIYHPAQKAEFRTAYWGFHSDDLLKTKRGQGVLTAVANLANYLVAVNTDPKTNQVDFKAPSASSWEEKPFAEGMTWDTATAVMGLEKLRDFMHNPAYDSQAGVNDVREALRKQPGGDLLGNAKRLDDVIKVGRDQIQARIVAQLKGRRLPQQNPARPLDTSLLLLAASDYVFVPGKPMQDARVRASLVQTTLKGLMGPLGVRRYNEFLDSGSDESTTLLHDSYLNKGYHLPDALRRSALGLAQATTAGHDYGSTDASSTEAMLDRQKLSSFDTSAQWCIGVSAGIQALSTAKQSAWTAIKASKKPASENTRVFLQGLDGQLLHLVNLAGATIAARSQADKPVIRADGSQVPDGSVMEAYEATPTLKPGQFAWRPGAHTLPWGTVQLYDGLKRAKKAAEMVVSASVV